VNTFYDDNGWWALAWLQAYDLTKNEQFLNAAMTGFDNMTAASPTKCGGGGIPWCANKPYIAAIANELYMQIAAKLARRVPSEHNKYLAIAEKQWAWFYGSNLLDKSRMLVKDGLKDDCSAQGNTSSIWSYNQGVVLGGLAELYRASGNKSYLDVGHKLAKASIAHLTDTKMIVHETCDNSTAKTCAPDGTQFKGIYIRNLLDLHTASPKDQYARLIGANAASVWTNDRDGSTGRINVDWAGNSKGGANASTHSSAMDVLVAELQLNAHC